MSELDSPWAVIQYGGPISDVTSPWANTIVKSTCIFLTLDTVILVSFSTGYKPSAYLTFQALD